MKKAVVKVKPEPSFDYESAWKNIQALIPTYNGNVSAVIGLSEGKIAVRSGGVLGNGDTLAEAMQKALEFLRAHASIVLEAKTREVATLRAAMGLAPEEK